MMRNAAVRKPPQGGLAMLTKAMTVDWAQYNIQSNGIAPGYFVTDLTRSLAADAQFDGWVKLRTPAKRWGKPEEQADGFFRAGGFGFCDRPSCLRAAGWPIYETAKFLKFFWNLKRIMPKPEINLGSCL